MMLIMLMMIVSAPTVAANHVDAAPVAPYVVTATIVVVCGALAPKPNE